MDDPITFRNTFAVRLQRARLAQGLSGRELGERAGLSPGTVSAIEKGASKKIHLQSAHALAIALKVPAAWLCFGEGKAPRFEKSHDS